MCVLCFVLPRNQKNNVMSFMAIRIHSLNCCPCLICEVNVAKHWVHFMFKKGNVHWLKDEKYESNAWYLELSFKIVFRLYVRTTQNLWSDCIEIWKQYCFIFFSKFDRYFGHSKSHRALNNWFHILYLLLFHISNLNRQNNNLSEFSENITFLNEKSLNEIVWSNYVWGRNCRWMNVFKKML